MAARTNRVYHNEETRKRIQTTQLLIRLQDNAFGKVELTQGQIKSIEILLKKTIPDISSIELSGDADNPVKIEFGWAQK